MSNPDPIEQAARIQEAIFKGNKIQAIKLYRAQTAVGLKEAKEAVEKLEADLRTASPDKFIHSEKKGCSVSALIAVLIVVTLWICA